MFHNCDCTPEEIAAGHRNDCILNKEFEPKPLPPPRKPFEEMNRDEMIIAYTALRSDLAKYVAELHAICRLGIQVAAIMEELPEMVSELPVLRMALREMLGLQEEDKLRVIKAHPTK